ncbi:hypothetical protein A2115_00140 [Candidatus Woesebacteria bacterium GWA1_41_8]|jgi:hypothetical protein|uniref:DUF5660 domain-containing protein n=1 Tax=Candidatus Woesebacteria bacterium GWA1_41_8 TaxID=1802471 RepID=A0A1F7WJ82_9BACT|nr:MAG: hypothetical protein A2115_00140 [Candidatus Woesebacteria bacterium GWA1_41_8]
MDKNQKQKAAKTVRANVLEQLKEIGASTGRSLKEDLIKKAPQDFMDQIFGPTPRTYSGEIVPGEAVEMKDIFTGQQEEKTKINKQFSLEKRLRQEESARVERKSNELRIQLKVIMDELMVLAQSTQELAKESQIAAFQAPIEPGIYHIIFFEKLLEFIKSFRKKIDEAVVWMHATNKRAEKKNYWSQFKKHGSKFLLSGEHYLQRSAG